MISDVELEDRHGDHWRRDHSTPDGWVRIEAPHVRRTREALERDYGPTGTGHTDRCIRRRTTSGGRP